LNMNLRILSSHINNEIIECMRMKGNTMELKIISKEIK